MKIRKELSSFWFFTLIVFAFLLSAILGAGFVWHDWKKLHEIDGGQIILIVACIFSAYVYCLWAILLRKKRKGLKTLLKEQNVASSRTACVNDNGNLVEFTLFPKDLLASLHLKRIGELTVKDIQSLSCYWTRLYRRLKPPSEEKKLTEGVPCLEQDLRPMVFEKPPAFKLLWADSGNSVALLLNDEPWAFIHEETHQGYSKGILKPQFGHPWDQELFEKTFQD
jgi:hypothetical protein